MLQDLTMENKKIINLSLPFKITHILSLKTGGEFMSHWPSQPWGFMENINWPLICKEAIFVGTFLISIFRPAKDHHRPFDETSAFTFHLTCAYVRMNNKPEAEVELEWGSRHLTWSPPLFMTPETKFFLVRVETFLLRKIPMTNWAWLC